MIKFEVRRYNFTRTETMGLLFIDDEYVCDTLELPWEDNKSHISCIPEGHYPIETYYSVSNKEERIRIDKVPNRSLIAIHPANKSSELLGCIAPGIKYGKEVLNSRIMMKKLLTSLDNKVGTLTVVHI